MFSHENILKLPCIGHFRTPREGHVTGAAATGRTAGDRGAGGSGSIEGKDVATLWE